MDIQTNTRYAHLVVSMVNIQRGQRVVLRGEPVLWDFFLVLAAEAYKKGASHVEVWPSSQQMDRVRVDHSEQDFLDYFPSDLSSRYQNALDDNTVFIRVHGTAAKDVFLGVDQERFAVFDKGYSKLGRPFLKALMVDTCQWIVVSYPTKAWAQRVLGDGASEKDLWAQLEPIVLGPEQDSIAWWKKSTKETLVRAKTLNDMKIKTLRLRDEGTDITFGFSEKAKWEAGGQAVSKRGTTFMCNLPSVEVFTAPDWRQTHGTVRLTRPVEINNIVVEGGKLVFEQGKLVRFSADKGEEALKTLFADERNARLGEFALVDKSSPIARSKRLFYNALIDENAAIHIALGRAYPTNIEGGPSMSEEELAAIGFNDALHHEDVMIGSDSSQVEVECYDGSRKEIMSDGSFVV